MPALPSKSAVRAALLASVGASLAAMARAAAETREGATHEESRAEGDKDMRATEQSYLARGQAMRAEALADELARLEATPFRAYGEDDAIGPFALVAARVDEAPRCFLLSPFGAGAELEVEGVRVTVLSPRAPAGQALVGRSVGDAFDLAQPGGGVRAWEIDAVA